MQINANLLKSVILFLCIHQCDYR